MRKSIIAVLSLILAITMSTSTWASAATATAAADGNRVLVAYFSKTGTTQSAAEVISRETGGDLLHIETVQPYPSSYQETLDIASAELAANARPALSTRVENMADYDVIFIGYPIWYGTAPMAVATFLESYDLQGKTIVPFCTSGGSSISGSISLIRSAATGATVVNGLTANGSDSAIASWARGVMDQLAPSGDGDDSDENPNRRLIQGVRNTTIQLRTTAEGTRGIRLRWTKSRGYRVDYYEVVRSTRRSSGYGTTPFYTTQGKGGGSRLTYLNTKSLRKGTRYYYRVRGVRVIDGQTYYTQWSNRGIRIPR